MAKKKVIEEPVVEIVVEITPTPAPIENPVKNEWCEMPHTKGS